MNIISKLQQGGGIPPYVSFINVPQSQVTAPYTSAEQSKESQEDVVTDEMKNLLYKEGIPVDVEAFLEQTSILSSPFNNDRALQYKTLVRYLPKIRWENQRLQQAIKQVASNSGTGEIAVTEHGYVITQNKEGKLSKKRISDVDFNNESLLTNNELINYLPYH